MAPDILTAEGVVEEFAIRFAAHPTLPGVMCQPGIFANSGVIELNSIGVPDAHQGKKHATAALKILADLCDENGLTITLIARPLPDLVPGCTPSLTVEQLVSWYRRYGFDIVGPNDDTFDMIRWPRVGAAGLGSARMCLRKKLTEISDGPTPEEHIRLVALLGKTIPHGIVPLQSPHQLLRYTCLVHALGFTEQAAYLAVAGSQQHTAFAGAAFAEWLWRNGALQRIAFEKALPGDLIWYLRSDGSFGHIGLLRDHKRVESKWGNQGFYEHFLLEVPEHYGDPTRATKPLPFDDAIEHFYRFTKEYESKQ
jgi:hypothetical protein